MKTKSVREKDRQRARDVKLKREREAEGDEFADKEMFVTSAYKKHQQELEEQAKQDEKNGKLYTSFSLEYISVTLLGARPQTPGRLRRDLGKEPA